jgi:uncharacterized protein YjbI with pentapeptide repeats
MPPTDQQLMSEDSAPGRDIGTQGGSYVERVTGHNIHAHTVVINEAPPPVPPAFPEESCKEHRQAAFVIQGSFTNLTPTDLAKLQAVVRVLQQLAGDASLTVVDILEGSIRLVLEGSEAGVERLQELFDSGQLTKILSVPVIAVEPVEVETQSKETPSSDPLKEMLITAINTQGAQGCDLSGSDLSGSDLSGSDLSGTNLRGAILRGAILRGAILRGAYLSGAYLSGTDLGGANLSGANLSGANLSGANLSGANLEGANLILNNLSGGNLSRANLSGADLSGADLSGADLMNANVQGAIFTRNIGLSKADKNNLRSRGAIFDDSPGDRSRSLVHSGR